MANIQTLVADIKRLVDEGKKVDEENLARFSRACGDAVRSALGDRSRRSVLRMSNLGSPCTRRTWYSIFHPKSAVPLPYDARLKFLFGHILESLLLLLAREAGHDVAGEQTELDLDGVKGHRDAVIDGHLVDVKSASSASFRKFASHGLAEEDDFGYLTQLGVYHQASKDDPVVADKENASFLAIDKTLGKITLDTWPQKGVDYRERVAEVRRDLERKTPPSRHYPDLPEGSSGNRKLGVACSYCEFKFHCWPGLRTFLYSRGNSYRPVFLTRVVREPKVPEITRTEAESEIWDQPGTVRPASEETE